MKIKLILSAIIIAIAAAIYFLGGTLPLAIGIVVVGIALVLAYGWLVKVVTLKFFRPEPNSGDARQLYKFLTYVYFAIIPVLLLGLMAAVYFLNSALNPYFTSYVNAVIIGAFLLFIILSTYKKVKTSFVGVPTGKILVLYFGGKAFLTQVEGLFISINWFKEEYYPATKIFISFSPVVEEREGTWARTVDTKVISTASPQLAVWDDKFTDEMKEKILGDKNNLQQAALKPSVAFAFKLEKVIFFVANMEGDTEHEKLVAFEHQVYNYALSRLNTEFKKYFYGQLLYLMTGSHLDDALQIDMELMVDGKRKLTDPDDSSKNLGMKCLEARVTSLGAPDELHLAINALIAQGFINTKNVSISEAEKLIQQNSGKSIAMYLEEILDINKPGFDPAEYIRLKLKVEAMEKSGATYITEWGDNSRNWDFVKKGLELLDEIKSTIKGSSI